MTLLTGPNLGVLVHGDLGEAHYTQLMAQWRAWDFHGQPRILDKDLTSAPGSASDGDAYIMASTWSGVPGAGSGRIARWSSIANAWEVYTPKAGWSVWVADEALEYRYNGTAWVNGRTALGLGSFSTADYAAAPFVNIMPDSGRFAGRINPLSVSTSASFTTSPFLSAYNGATISNAGKFISNNNDFGGTSGALTATVLSFINALGRTGDVGRYGVEFYISRFLAGSGTALPSVGTDGVTRYLLSTNGGKAIFSASAFATFTVWLRPDSPVHIAVGSFHNGISKPPNTPIPANVWTHVRAISSTLIGYDSAFPRIYSPPGANIDVALPAFFSGIVDTGLHTAPIPTINEVSA